MRRLLTVFLLAVGLGLATAACNPLEYKAKAGLQVITGDIPASLFLDGQYLEKTPFIGKDIKPGTYTLRIQPDNPLLQPYEVSVSLEKGLLTVVTWRPGERPELSGGVIYEMEKLPTKGRAELAVVSIPDGAIISLQGREKEFAPTTISQVDPGQKEFEVSLPSYETQRHTLNVVDGYRIKITVKLAKNDVIEVMQNGLTAAETASPSGTALSPLASESAQTVSSAGRQASISAQAASSSPSVAGASTDNGKITIQPTNYFENEQEVLKVRDAASSNGTVIGTAPVGTSYAYLNETFGGWYKIQFGKVEGWVSGQYAKLGP